MLSSGNKEGDILLRNDFVDIIKEYFKKFAYIDIFWEEKIIILLKYGIIKAILSSMTNEKYKSLIYDKMREKEEIYNLINKKIKEWYNKDIKRETVIECIEKINKDYEKKNNDLNFYVCLIKKNLNKGIVNEIYENLEGQIIIKKDLNLSIKEIYDNNIIFNKIFWLSSRNFISNNQNKKFLNKEGYYILNYLKNIIELLKYDFKNKQKMREIKEYLELIKNNKQNLFSNIEIHYNKENKNIVLYKPIEEAIILNNDILKEIKKYKLHLLKIKENRIKYYYENKILDLKDFIYFIKWIMMIMDKSMEYIYGKKEKMENMEVIMIINKFILEDDEIEHFALDTEIMEDEEYKLQKEFWSYKMRMHNNYLNVC